MKDEYFAELISRRLDGDLTKKEQDELYEHLADCPECRKLAEDMLFISSLTDDSLVEPPDTLSASVMRSVKLEKSRKKRIIPGLGGVLAASIAVVLLVRGGYFGGPNDTGMPDSNGLSMQNTIAETGGIEDDTTLSTFDLDEPQLRSAPVEGTDDMPMPESGEEVSPVSFRDMAEDTAIADTAAPVESGAGVDTVTPPASEPTTQPTAESVSDAKQTRMFGYVMTSDTMDGGSDASQYSVDSASVSNNVESAQSKMALMAVPVSPDTASVSSNSLNVSSNRLNIDHNDMVAVSYNGNRVAAGDPGFGDITGQVLGYLTTLELNESTAVPSTTTEYVVEYADGHSETLLYSADGYLNCNGVWYKLDTPTE